MSLSSILGNHPVSETSRSHIINYNEFYCTKTQKNPNFFFLFPFCDNEPLSTNNIRKNKAFGMFVNLPTMPIAREAIVVNSQHMSTIVFLQWDQRLFHLCKVKLASRLGIPTLQISVCMVCGSLSYPRVLGNEKCVMSWHILSGAKFFHF